MSLACLDKLNQVITGPDGYVNHLGPDEVRQRFRACLSGQPVPLENDDSSGTAHHGVPRLRKDHRSTLGPWRLRVSRKTRTAGSKARV